MIECIASGGGRSKGFQNHRKTVHVSLRLVMQKQQQQKQQQKTKANTHNISGGKHPIDFVQKIEIGIYVKAICVRSLDILFFLTISFTK